MKHSIFLIRVMLIMSFLISCKQEKQVVPIVEDGSNGKEVQNELEPIPAETPKRLMDQGTYSIVNGGIRYKPSPEEMEERKKMIEDAKRPQEEEYGVSEDYIDRRNPSNEKKDFSSFETHPLGVFLGKWYLLEYYGNRHPRGSYIEFILDEGMYKYILHSSRFKEPGRLYYLNSDEIILWPDRETTIPYSYTVVDSLDNIRVYHRFLLDNEGPYGYFQLETEEDLQSSRVVEDVNGNWVGNFELIDGTPIQKLEYSWGRGFSLADTTLEIDLGSGTVLVPGKGKYKIMSAHRDVQGTIFLDIFPEADETSTDITSIRITFLDRNKACIVHDRWEEWDDKRYSPEEEWPWFRLSGPGGD